MTEFKPFAEIAQETVIPSVTGELTIASDTESVSIYGTLDLVRSPESLEHARQLQAILEQIIAALEAGPFDPTAGEVDPNAIKSRKNPFGG